MPRLDSEKPFGGRSQKRKIKRGKGGLGLFVFLLVLMRAIAVAQLSGCFGASSFPTHASPQREPWPARGHCGRYGGRWPISAPTADLRRCRSGMGLSVHCILLQIIVLFSLSVCVRKGQQYMQRIITSSISRGIMSTPSTYVVSLPDDRQIFALKNCV